MSDFYSILIAELRDDPLGVGYANMTDDEVAASLNEPRFRVPTTRFITWRAIAGVLTDFYETLITELQTDPLGRGYAQMSDEQVATTLNERNRRVPTAYTRTIRAE